MKIISLVAPAPVFQTVIPLYVRKLFNLLLGQQKQMRAVGEKIKVVTELPMSAARGMFPGVDAKVPNDPEGLTWPGGCDPLAESFLDINQRAFRLLEYLGNGSNADFLRQPLKTHQNCLSRKWWCTRHLNACVNSVVVRAKLEASDF